MGFEDRWAKQQFDKKFQELMKEPLFRPKVTGHQASHIIRDEVQKWVDLSQVDNFPSFTDWVANAEPWKLITPRQDVQVTAYQQNGKTYVSGRPYRGPDAVHTKLLWAGSMTAQQAHASYVFQDDWDADDYDPEEDKPDQYQTSNLSQTQRRDRAMVVNDSYQGAMYDRLVAPLPKPGSDDWEPEVLKR